MKPYASGEQPQVGDLVRRIGRNNSIKGRVFAVGDVAEVTSVYFWPTAGGMTHNPEYLTLIARAGETVKFQPGDVVEAVRVPHPSGWCSLTPRWNVGDHLTVTGIQVPGMHPMFHDIDYSYRRDGFKLVHRPDPAPATPAETLQATPPGTRVRITTSFEASSSPTATAPTSRSPATPAATASCAQAT